MGERFICKMIPLDVEFNFKLLQTVIQGRSAGAAGKYADVKFKPALMLMMSSKDADILDALKAVGKEDVSFGIHIAEKARNAEEFFTTTHPFVMHKELKTAQNEIEELNKELINSGPVVNISMDQNLPDRCSHCKEGKQVQAMLDAKDKEIAKDEALINAMDTRFEDMQNKFMQMLQSVHPDIDFNCPNRFKERPSDSALSVWFSKLMYTKNTKEFLEVFENTHELDIYKNIDPAVPDDELTSYINNMMMLLSELLKIYAIITDPNSEDGEAISETEAKVIEPLLMRLKGIMLKISKHLNEKKCR